MGRAVPAGGHRAQHEGQQNGRHQSRGVCASGENRREGELGSVKRRTGKQVTYDPRRSQGVTLYREAVRAFSRGDRVQFTAPDREQHISNRELATVEKIDRKGNIHLRLDSGRPVRFYIKENPHLDYGYAVTSHSSQGQTADRVLVHVDMKQAGEKLLNRRLAYVAVSRGSLSFLRARKVRPERFGSGLS